MINYDKQKYMENGKQTKERFIRINNGDIEKVILNTWDPALHNNNNNNNNNRARRV